MHLVDRYVNMQVICIDMNSRNALMICKADCLAKFVLYRMKHFKRWIFPRRK